MSPKKKKIDFQTVVKVITLLVLFSFIAGSIIIGGLSFHSGTAPSSPTSQNSSTTSVPKSNDENEIKEWRDAAKRNPKDVFVLRNLSRKLLENGHDFEAGGVLVRALKLAPNDPLNYELLGKIDMKRSHFKAAIKDFQKALELKPNDVEFELELADARAFAGDVMGARSEYKGLIVKSKDPMVVVRARLALMELSMHQSDLKEAQTQAMALYQVAPDPRLLSLLGGIAEKENKWDAAIGYYQRASRAFPLDFSLSEKLAELYSKQGRYAEAATLLNALIVKNPKNSELKYSLAMADLKLGKKGEAKDLLARALREAANEKDEKLKKRIMTALSGL